MNFKTPSNLIIHDFDLAVKKYNNGHVEVRSYNRPLQYKEQGYEEVLSDYQSLQKIHDDLDKKLMSRSKKIQRDSGVIESSNLNRSFIKLVDLALHNSHHFHSFLTLTFAENIELTPANEKFNLWCKRVRYRFPNFMYLAVPEFQKNGRVHYHLLTNLRCGVEIEKRERIKTGSIKENYIKYQYLDYYDCLDWSVSAGLGYSSAFDLQLADDKFSVSAYMAKYFFKDIDKRFFGRRKIMYSQNLDRVEVERLNTNSQDYINLLAWLNEEKEIVSNDVVKSTKKFAPSFIKDVYKDRKEN